MSLAYSLDKRIVIQQKTSAKDAAGQTLDGWSPFASLWANVLFQRGAESLRADKDTSTASASIRIRHLAGITTAMRVLYAGEYYQIHAVLPQGNRMIDLTVERIK
jgi:SPP1 family predicted phage head-tail adaptor